MWLNEHMLRRMSAQSAPPTSRSPLVSAGAGGSRRYGTVAHRRNTTVEPVTNVALMMTVMASREAYVEQVENARSVTVV